MGNRVQVGDLRQAPKKRVQASAVDTYIAPIVDKPQESNTSQLANALVKFEPSLQNMVKAHGEKAKAREVNQGQMSQREFMAQRDAAKENLEGFKQLIDDGEIHAGQSPWFKKGYNYEKGLYLKRKYAEVVSKSYTQWNDNERQSDNPLAFNVWMAKQRTEFNTSNNIGENPDVLRGFNEGAALTENNLSMHHIKVKAEKLVTDRQNLMSANTQLDVKAFQKSKNEAVVVKKLEERMQHFRFEGGDATKGNELVVNSVIQQAIDSSDTKVLKLLDKLNPSGRGALSTQPKVARQLQVARDQINRKITQEANQAYIQEQRDKKQYAETKTSEAFQMIRDDPTYKIPDEVMFAVTREFPEFPSTLIKLKRMQTAENQLENEDLTLPIYVGVAEGRYGTAYIHKMIREDVIRNPSTADSLLRTATRVAQSGRKGYGTGSTTADDNLKDIEKGLSDTVKLTSKGRTSDAKAYASTKAVLRFKRGMHEWIAKNGEATEKEITDYGDYLMGRLAKVYTKDRVDKRLDAVDIQDNNAKELLAEERGDLGDWSRLPLFNSKEELINEVKLAQEGHPSMFKDTLEQYGITDPLEIQNFLNTQLQLIGQ